MKNILKVAPIGVVALGLMLSGSALAGKSMSSSIQELPSASDSGYITKNNEVYKKLSSSSYIMKDGKVFLKAGKVVTIHNAGGMKPKKVMLCGLKCGWKEFTD